MGVGQKDEAPYRKGIEYFICERAKVQLVTRVRFLASYSSMYRIRDVHLAIVV